MHDDGANGDLTANDKVYSLRLTMNEQTAGLVRLQVSAAFQGVMKRVMSPILEVQIWNLHTDQKIGVTFAYPALPNITPRIAADANGILSFDATLPGTATFLPAFTISTGASTGYSSLNAWFTDHVGRDCGYCREHCPSSRKQPLGITLTALPLGWLEPANCSSVASRSAWMDADERWTRWNGVVVRGVGELFLFLQSPTQLHLALGSKRRPPHRQPPLLHLGKVNPTNGIHLTELVEQVTRSVSRLPRNQDSYKM